MTKISISSQLCEYTHTINGKVEWDKIIVEISTPFEKFKANPCPELPLLGIPGSRGSCILKITVDGEPDCSRKYPIPDAGHDICSHDICSTENRLAVAML